MKTLAQLKLFRLLAISFVFTVIIHPGLWVAIANGYKDDYIFNLTPLEIVGLILITSVLALLLFLACTVSSYLLSKSTRKYLARWLVVLSCIVLALLICAVALALVPQLHYLYYRLILPELDLLAQWVPFGNLSLNTLWRYLLLSADDNTTHHAKGITVWVCVCASALVAYQESKVNSDKS